MSALSRRQAKKRTVTFRLVIEAQEMIVKYYPEWMEDTDQFEFRSPFNPKRRIPISETGYRSHFAPVEDVKASGGARSYPRDLVLTELASNEPRQAKNQLRLF
jgi:hypothetical protein